MILSKKSVRMASIRRWIGVAACVAMLAGPGFAAAQSRNAAGPRKPRHEVPSRQRFLLDKSVFITADFEHRTVPTELAKWMRARGIAASNAFNKAKGRISFVRVKTIEGAAGNDAWRMEVGTRQITVSFTTENSLKHAVEAVKNAVRRGETDGKFYIQGGVTIDWGTRTAARDHDATADAATSLRPVSDLEAAVKRLGGKSREVYLILVNSDSWRMESPSLAMAGSTQRLYPTDGYYSIRQLRLLADAARKSQVEIIPTLELFAENKPLVAAFGHSIFSVEGMRFVRAAIEDCVEILRPNKICLGRLSNEADMRYLEFISDLAAMLNVELVIIES